MRSSLRRRVTYGQREFPRSGSPPRGFTLFEMLIVLAIVALVAGLSGPRLIRYVQENDVKTAAETVRHIVDTARYHSVEKGVIYQFRYEPYGQRFLLLPFEALDDQQQAQQQTTDFSRQQQTTGQLYTITKTVAFMPPPMKLGDHFPVERLSMDVLRQVVNGSELQAVSWSPPVLFYPDGSATDHYFTVEDQQLRSITLSVRGLTGTVAASQLNYLSESASGR